MASCLGLYIESNLIKYAKVTKEKDLLKIDAFGVKFYDTLGQAISQIVSETYSYKTPISINLSDEMYEYFYFFNLLSKNDLKEAIETEFESYCQEKQINRNSLETRYSLTPNIQDKEKIKTIFISANKTEINQKEQEVGGNFLTGIYPLPMCMPNIISTKEKENSIIINIEEQTTITTIINQNIYEIKKIDDGMSSILYNIKEKENSYSKAYEICKNTTIYTIEGTELSKENENIYLEDIMPTLYSIAEKTKEYIDNSIDHIDKIYITGSGTVINNIDLYFEEFFSGINCEIIKPYFINENVKINVKDYIEVNSAIALAMQGLGHGVKDLNFKKLTLANRIPLFVKNDKSGNKDTNENGKKGKGKFNFDFSFDFKAELDAVERWFLRTITGILVFIIMFSAISTILKMQTEEKTKEVQEVITDTNKQISKIDSDIQALNNKTSNYKKMSDNLKNYSNIVAERLRTKNEIPLLLTEIMNVIPKGVTITSIENTTESHIVINAQSEDYASLGFFKGRIITDGILSPSTVISTSGVKQDGIVKIVIEGDLP